MLEFLCIGTVAVVFGEGGSFFVVYGDREAAPEIGVLDHNGCLEEALVDGNVGVGLQYWCVVLWFRFEYREEVGTVVCGSRSRCCLFDFDSK
jgi:hypothetical protein